MNHDKPADLPARYADGRFGPGNPGRPMGSVNRASRRAALVLLEHFQANQALFLDKMVDGSVENRRIYAGLISHVLPRQVEVGPSDATPICEEELKKAIARVRMAREGYVDRNKALADIEAILTGQGELIEPGPLIRRDNGEAPLTARPAPAPAILPTPAPAAPLIRSNNGGGQPRGRAAWSAGAALPGLGAPLKPTLNGGAKQATVNTVG
jgi:hypothetical protein